MINIYLFIFMKRMIMYNVIYMYRMIRKLKIVYRLFWIYCVFIVYKYVLWLFGFILLMIYFNIIICNLGC